MASLPEFVASVPEFVASLRASLRCAAAAVVADSASMSDGAAASVPDSGLDSGLGSGLGASSVSLCAESWVSDAHSALGSGSVSLGSCSEVLSGELGDAGDGEAEESEADGVSSEDIVVGNTFHEQAAPSLLILLVPKWLRNRGLSNRES